MNIKSLLLGSAAALAAVSLVHATDISPSGPGGSPCMVFADYPGGASIKVDETILTQLGAPDETLIITTSPPELASNEVGIITADPFEVATSYPDGNGIKASDEIGVITGEDVGIIHGVDIGARAALEDPGPKMDKLAQLPQGGLLIRPDETLTLASNETSIIEPDGGTIFHLASLEVGIIEREGDGGMKKPNLLLKEAGGRL